MSTDIRGILDQIVGHLSRSGLYGQVSAYEPKAPPETASGPAAAVFLGGIRTTQAFTSLNSTSIVIPVTIRLHISMLQEPQGDIDVALFEITERTMELITGDFTLGDEVTNVDLLGMAGGGGGTQGNAGMEARFGYITIGSTMYRVSDIDVPVMVADAWAQAR